MDDKSIHPEYICNSCYPAFKYADKAGPTYVPNVSLHTWQQHQSDECNTCGLFQEIKKGGHPTKKKGDTMPLTSIATHLLNILIPLHLLASGQKEKLNI